MLLNTPLKSESVPVKIHSVDQVLCKSILPHDPIPVASPIDVENLNVKFTPIRLPVFVVKCLLRPLLLYGLNAPTIFAVNTALHPDVCNVVSRINTTQQSQL